MDTSWIDAQQRLSPKVAVVILNWNGRHLLERFLPPVLKYSNGLAEVIVADNGSDDDSLAFMASDFPEVRVISMQENAGFAGGYNKALAGLDADYYVLLNSDIEVSEGWIEPCIALMEALPGVAACQPKIRALDDPACFEYAGAAGGFIDHLGYPFCRGRMFQTLEQDHGQYDDTTEVFWASGAAMFVRADAFWKAGGFDQGFFAHMEEIDLCWRFANLGYKVMVCPDSLVFHVGGASLPRSNPGKTYLNFRNNLMMMAKNMHAMAFYPRLLIRLVLDELAAFVFILKGQFRDALAVYRAQLSLLWKLPSLRRESKNLSAPLPGSMYKKSVVAAYYVWRKKRFSDLFPKNSRAST